MYSSRQSSSEDDDPNQHHVDHLIAGWRSEARNQLVSLSIGERQALLTRLLSHDGDDYGDDLSSRICKRPRGEEQHPRDNDYTQHWKRPKLHHEQQPSEEELEDEYEDRQSSSRLFSLSRRVQSGKTRDDERSSSSRPLPGSAGKLTRWWKQLARKSACKAGKTRLALRRDLVQLAKRTARECARLIRQRQIAYSHKLARDAHSRASRLAREIAGHWRAGSNATDNGSLTLSGVVFPLASQTSHIAQSRQFTNLAYCCQSLLGVKGSSDDQSLDTTALLSAAAQSTDTGNRRVKGRVEKAAAEQRRADLELLEARRQQRKLNFLITQTELYAHFMAGKAVVGEPTSSSSRILDRLDDDSEACSSAAVQVQEATGNFEDESQLLTSKSKSTEFDSAARAAADRLGVNYDEEFDTEALKLHALNRVKLAIENQRMSSLQSIVKHEHNSSQLPDNSLDELSDNQSHTSVKVISDVPIDQSALLTKRQPVDDDKQESTIVPSLFHGQLKSYQLAGLEWLVSLYRQGINGILADEMGLGKTVQTIAFLAHLAEVYNIWGPFLVITPSSTLHNWTQEFTKFLPSFHLVPYWGSPVERRVLRRFWPSSKQSDVIGSRQCQLHVVVTSYQIVLQDAKFINKTAWSYIVLDEAHAIKSTESMRWRILLSLKCRNRLLLTGTPIQNTMQELWALLHFIMPTLFDSHNEFANWFSRDIESQAANSTSTPSTNAPGLSSRLSKLDENQLGRLHLILKPFMLRRVKAEVEHEMSDKIEIMRYCPLSRRQTALYARLRNKLSLDDINCLLRVKGTTTTNTTAPCNLINLVMQLRKACNHPDLCDPRQDGFPVTSIVIGGGSATGWSLKMMQLPVQFTAFAFSRLMCLSPLELALASSSPLIAWLLSHPRQIQRYSTFKNECASVNIGRIWPRHLVLAVRDLIDGPAFEPPRLVTASLVKFKALARPVQLYTNQPNHLHDLQSHHCHLGSHCHQSLLVDDLESTLVGRDSISCSIVASQLLLANSSMSSKCVDPVSIETRLGDSGKLDQLDKLLAELKDGGDHKVLIYSQMTRMIDIIEELMLHRRHSYLRLDGSSRLADRRDMVAQWQSRPDLFVFLLSTRAGGLGINLTSADTVIFYDSDWNPTVDQQAMDRAHRLGQTRTVTVYRLICPESVESRMLQRAQVKRAMHQMVIAEQSTHVGGNDSTSKNNTANLNESTSNVPPSTSDMVSLLLLDDDELVQRSSPSHSLSHSLQLRRRHQQSSVRGVGGRTSTRGQPQSITSSQKDASCRGDVSVEQTTPTIFEFSCNLTTTKRSSVEENFENPGDDHPDPVKSSR